MQLEIIDIAWINMWEKAKRKLLDDGSSSHSIGYNGSRFGLWVSKGKIKIDNGFFLNHAQWKMWMHVDVCFI